MVHAEARGAAGESAVCNAESILSAVNRTPLSLPKCCQLTLLNLQHGFFYFDDSTHEKGGFTLGAFVYSERSLDGPVSEALRASDLVPYVDEFKSGSRMDRHPEQVRARYELRGVFRSLCRVGVIVAAVSAPGELGLEALMGLEKIISANRLRPTPMTFSSMKVRS